MVPFSDIFLFTVTQSCVWEEDRFWSLVNRLSRKKEIVTGFIAKSFIWLCFSYRNLLRYPGGMMSAFGPLNSLWKKHTGSVSFTLEGKAKVQISLWWVAKR